MDPLEPISPAAAQAAKTIIDGYNLMYALGVVGKQRGSRGLEHSRKTLLNLLAESLPPEDAPRTVVVFDAERPPPGLPRTTQHRGLQVYFAANHEDADALMEELIARHSAPRQLTVVSSDHRLHKAARRRKAKAMDSDAWFDDLLRRRNELNRPSQPPAKPASPEQEHDLEFWLREFESLPSEDSEAAPSADAPSPRGPRPRRMVKPDRQGRSRPAKPPRPQDDLLNPFPPGYGEDLLREEDA